MMNEKTIAILLATYNGEAYLREQLESIVRQTYKDWSLYIHDDGSSDSTLQIIKDYQEKDNRIFFINDEKKHLGPGLGFMSLLESIDSKLYMFCDQDDVWLDNKIEISYNSYVDIKDHEQIPVVVHSDVSVVDENLNIIAQSYWKEINLNPDKINKFPYFCVCVYTNGNTMLFNEKAKELCFPLFNGPIMHDRYVSSNVLKAKGIVLAVHKPLVLYRQHGANVCGFQVGESRKISQRLKGIKSVIIDNYQTYQILQHYKFGSLFKYIWYKLLVEIHLNFRKNY